MLSRVADSLYWMSRYLERAEHTAQVLDVNLQRMLEQAPRHAARRWERVMKTLRLVKTKPEKLDAFTLTSELTFNPSTRESILACMAAARENARQVREQIPSEMWEKINKLYLRVKSATMEDVWRGESHEFLSGVREGIHLFHGITDGLMNHNEGWHFIQVGRFIERAQSTAALLGAYGPDLVNAADRIADVRDYFEWVGMLRSCMAFEAYCKVYTADLRPERITEFLLLNAEFPRSVHFSAIMVQSALNAIAEFTGTKKASRANRLAGRLRSMLGFSQIDEILGEDLNTYLDDIQHHCAQIHVATHQIYISYPIESALAS
ncbi:MAG: alpha-E domain-containing protein [Candidatus Sumerlaeaceae bacterium]|nr:alpha-E domain-containing protein [Candidatus Sumerlaeaceae bacterium]